MGKILIIIGVLLIAAGLIIQLADRLPWLGRLPGDIVIEKSNFKVYIPLVTSLLVSVLLSLMFFLFNRYKN